MEIVGGGGVLGVCGRVCVCMCVAGRCPVNKAYVHVLSRCSNVLLEVHVSQTVSVLTMHSCVYENIIVSSGKKIDLLNSLVRNILSPILVLIYRHICINKKYHQKYIYFSYLSHQVKLISIDLLHTF